MPRFFAFLFVVLLGAWPLMAASDQASLPNIETVISKLNGTEVALSGKVYIQKGLLGERKIFIFTGDFNVKTGEQQQFVGSLATDRATLKKLDACDQSRNPTPSCTANLSAELHVSLVGSIILTVFEVRDLIVLK